MSNAFPRYLARQRPLSSPPPPPQVRDLMSKAFRGPLVPSQQQQVLVELEGDAKLVYHCGLTPKRCAPICPAPAAAIYPSPRHCGLPQAVRLHVT